MGVIALDTVKQADFLRVIGRLRIFDDHGFLLSESKNLVVNTGLSAIVNALANSTGVPGILQFALGTGTNAVVATNTTLQTEVFRTPPTNNFALSQNVLESDLYLPTGSANGNVITEAGLFVGTTATNTANSGVMLARVTFANPTSPNPKTSVVALTFQWQITFNAP